MASWPGLSRWQRRLLWSLVGVLWVCGSVVGLSMLAAYSNSPGEARSAPLHWPGDSAIGHRAGRATLILFAHPRCPCTRASLGELEKIVARYHDRVAVWVVFLQPRGMPEAWWKTDLWRSAQSIPSVHVIGDTDGADARRFRALTSGQTLLYDRDGELVFDGGITYARGHAGDNAGRDAIESCLSGKSPGDRRTPVFGCAMFATAENESGGD